MSNARMIQVVALLAMGAAVLGALQFSPRINEHRRNLNMMGSATPAENAPPQYAIFIQALGAFRGLVTDILFIRATELKEAGRYFDAYQLAQFICELQPRFPSVWEFNAWNMAWNISVATHTPEERWNWVYNGVKLLRDRGLKYNPRAINMYKQLAWIFVNKMSENIDEHHFTYKREWAWRMHLVLGPPPNPLGNYDPDEIFEAVPADAEDRLLEAARIEQERRDARLRAEGVATPGAAADGAVLTAAETAAQITPYSVVLKAAVERLQAIAAMPEELEALYARHPGTRAMVAALREMDVRITDDDLSEEAYWHRETGLAFTFFYRVRLLTERPSIQAKLTLLKTDDRDRAARERFAAILGIAEKNEDGQALIRFMQKKVLRQVYELKPEVLVELTKIFGPMDWRAVDAHSLYWVNEGLVAGGESISRFGNDKTNTARMLFFSLRNLRERNKIIFEPFPPAIHQSYFSALPDMNFIEPLHRAYLMYGKMIDPDPGRGVGETFRTGHINFLRESIVALFLAGRETEAQQYYDYIRTTYQTRPDGSLDPKYAAPLGDFVTDVFYEGIEGARETNRAIGQILFAAYLELSEGNFTTYDNLVRRAGDLHRKFMEDKIGELSEAKKLPPFADMQVDALAAWLMIPATDQNIIFRKVFLWKVARVDFRQTLYDDLRDGLAAECEVWELDFAKAFPEPPGMDEFRKRRDAARPPEPPAAETPAPAPQ